MTTAQDLQPRLRTREDLYELIREGGGRLTRSDLVNRSGLSRSTVNQAVSRLLADGRLAEIGVDPKGPGSGSGRPAATLQVTASAAPVAGIDFGHNHIYVAVADALGTMIGHAEEQIDVDLEAVSAMDTAATMLDTLRAEHGVTELSAVVAGIPGPLDLKTGLVRSPTILSGWVGLDPARDLAQRLGVSVRIENDAVLGATGELAYGAGQTFDDFLYVKVSHGVGAAVVINRRPYRGSTGLAGEIGHTHLPGRSELCRCGDRGCLEAAASVSSVREQIAHTRPGAAPSSIDFSAAHDPIASRILNEAGRTIGEVLADLCNLLNPAAVIVGGELGASGPQIIEGIESSMRRRAQPSIVEALQVLPAALGIRAEITGAVHIAATNPARLS